MTAALVDDTFGYGRGHYFDGSKGRELVHCPDCGQAAALSLGGDHGGSCIASVRYPSPTSALGIVRAHALSHERFSMNQLRQAFMKAGCRKASRAQALQAACRNNWIEPVGYEPSSDAKTKGHAIRVYRSRIFDPHPKQERPR